MGATATPRMEYPYTLSLGEVMVHPALNGVERRTLHNLLFSHATGDCGGSDETDYFRKCREGLTVSSIYQLRDLGEVVVTTTAHRTVTMVKPLSVAWK